MITDKKNQHYVPKFYLRNFSYENNKKQIGLFNVNNELYISKAVLKSQGSKNFFYGQDGMIEDNLSTIEGDLAIIIRQILNDKNVPRKNTKDHYRLLLFVTLTDLRNPMRVSENRGFLEAMRKKLLEVDSNTDIDKMLPIPTDETLIRHNLASISEIAPMMLDLDYKILLNRTSNPYITSDFPIVKYNQYLEGKKWNEGKTGYSATGLQIFVPINHEVLLVFYDSGIYKLGDKRKNLHIITDSTEVDQINLLHFLNCTDTIYFDEKATEKYIRFIYMKSKKYQRANQTNSALSYVIAEGDEESRRSVNLGLKNFVKVNNTACETNLKIKGIKIHTRGKKHELDDSLAQMRPFAMKIYDERQGKDEKQPSLKWEFK